MPVSTEPICLPSAITGVTPRMPRPSTPYSRPTTDLPELLTSTTVLRISGEVVAELIQLVQAQERRCGRGVELHLHHAVQRFELLESGPQHLGQRIAISPGEQILHRGIGSDGVGKRQRLLAIGVDALREESLQLLQFTLGRLFGHAGRQHHVADRRGRHGNDDAHGQRPDAKRRPMVN